MKSKRHVSQIKRKYLCVFIFWLFDFFCTHQPASEVSELMGGGSTSQLVVEESRRGKPLDGFCLFHRVQMTSFAPKLVLALFAITNHLPKKSHVPSDCMFVMSFFYESSTSGMSSQAPPIASVDIPPESRFLFRFGFLKASTQMVLKNAHLNKLMGLLLCICRQTWR